MPEPPEYPEIICIGRIGIDMYPTDAGPLTQVSTFRKSLGGSAANVAVAAARLGKGVGLVSAVGDDALGAYARMALREFGVDDRWVASHADARTPLVIAELDPPETPRIHFYRDADAPDMTIEDWQLDADALAQAGIVWITGTGLSTAASRTDTLRGFAAGRMHRIVDLDWRPALWPDPADATDAFREAIAAATTVIGGQAECAVAVGDGAPEQQAARLLGLGANTAVVKCGAEGTYVRTDTAEAFVPPTPVEVVCGLGAGDAFGGAFSAWLLDGADPLEATRAGSVAGALVAGRLACADAMPSYAEVVDHMEAAHATGTR